MRRLTILEKHSAVITYSLQDLMGISPTLCTHRKPIDPDSTLSRKPQHRLNNAMRQFIKIEVLKLSHSGIIYPVPHHWRDSRWKWEKWVNPLTNHHEMENVYRPLMKCKRGLQTIPSFVFLMAIQVAIKFPSMPMTKAKSLSHALMAPIPVVGCFWGCVTHLHLFKDVWCLFSLIWSKKSWNFSWTTFLSMVKLWL